MSTTTKLFYLFWFVVLVGMFLSLPGCTPKYGEPSILDLVLEAMKRLIAYLS